MPRRILPRTVLARSSSRTFFSILLLIFLGTGLFDVEVKGSNADDLLADQEYVDQDREFSIRFPKGWIVKQPVSSDNIVIKAIHHADANRFAAINIYAWARNPEYDVTTMLPRELFDLTYRDKAQLLNSGKVTLDDQSVTWLELKMKGGPGPSFALCYIVVGEKTLWQLFGTTVMGDESWFIDNKRAFYESFSSFRLRNSSKKNAIKVHVNRDVLPDKPKMIKPILQDAISVFTLKIAQDHSILAIKNKFPDLGDKVFEVQSEFNRAFGKAIEATRAYLMNELGSEWEKQEKSLTQLMAQSDFQEVTKTQAIEYIETVRRRAKGEIPSQIYRVLAALNPDFLEKPHMEVVKGFTKSYDSDGNGKALGLKVSFMLPKSWDESEGRRPHVLRNFTSHDSLASGMLLVKKAPEGKASLPDHEAIQYLSSKEYLAVEMPDAQFVSNGTTTIASIPSCYVDFSRLISRTVAGQEIRIATRDRIYFLIYKKKLVALSLGVSDSEGRSRGFLEAEFKKREILFDLMAQSLDFYNRYP